jgi:hypothetical protein
MAVYTNVAKPGTIDSVLIEVYKTGQNGFGNDDGANNKILIKTETVQLGFGVQVVETTGDGDSVAKYDHGSLLRVQFTVSGYALAADVIGLSELESDSTGATGGEGNGDYPMQFNYHGSTRSIRGLAMIENIVMSYSKKSPVVGLQMRGYLRIDTAATLEIANTP